MNELLHSLTAVAITNNYQISALRMAISIEKYRMFSIINVSY